VGSHAPCQSSQADFISGLGWLVFPARIMAAALSGYRMVDVAIFSPKNHNGLSRWRNIAISLKMLVAQISK
jgi:hypothetical protein